MVRFYTLLLLIAFFQGVSAQNARDSVAFYGRVMDSFMHEMLKGVHVEIMRTDSSLNAEFDTKRTITSYGYPHNVYGKVTSAGYMQIPRQIVYSVSPRRAIKRSVSIIEKMNRREFRYFIGEVLLRKKSKPRDTQLGEATVTASKIRMVVKGDSLVYNADAFQLSEGTMLDGLIKRLPGFELRDGQITVNGQYVSSLLVNGEDFFRGDPRVALENLPAYAMLQVAYKFSKQPKK